MLKYSPFYTQIWSDKKFKTLSTDAKLIFIYTFTTDELTLTGIYTFNKEVCKLKTHLTKGFDVSFTEVMISGLIKYDEKEDMIWVINRFKLLPAKSAKVIVGAIDELNHIRHSFREDFLKKYLETAQRANQSRVLLWIFLLKKEKFIIVK